MYVPIELSPYIDGVPRLPFIYRYRFAEIRYHRPEEQHKGRVIPARVETVLIFLPDVWSCSPSRLEWDGLAVAYKRQLAEKYKDDTAVVTGATAAAGGDDTQAL